VIFDTSFHIVTLTSHVAYCALYSARCMVLASVSVLVWSVRSHEIRPKRLWYFCVLDLIFDHSAFNMQPRVIQRPYRNILVFIWSKADYFGGRSRRRTEPHVSRPKTVSARRL